MTLPDDSGSTCLEKLERFFCVALRFAAAYVVYATSSGSDAWVSMSSGLRSVAQSEGDSTTFRSLFVNVLPASSHARIFVLARQGQSPRGGGLVPAAQARRGPTPPGRKRPAVNAVG